MIPADFTPKISSHDTLDSTNTKARELAAQGASEGTVVWARQQTQGRGRLKRAWHSPEGGLYLSVLLYPKDPRRLTDLSILTGVALAQAVKESLPKQVAVSVKWPNDCLLNWKKVGGILCESLGEEFFHLCVVGIGLNVNIPETELASFRNNPFSATSFQVATGAGHDVVKIRDRLLSKLFNMYRVYHQDGFPHVQYLWERNCEMIGKKVELRDSGWRDLPAGDTVGATVGTCLGIDEAGAIVLSNAKGERHTYHTGEITCFWP